MPIRGGTEPSFQHFCLPFELAPVEKPQPWRKRGVSMGLRIAVGLWAQWRAGAARSLFPLNLL